MSITKKLLQAASGNAGGDNLYVEDVFATHLVTGTNAAVTVNNGLGHSARLRSSLML